MSQENNQTEKTPLQIELEEKEGGRNNVAIIVFALMFLTGLIGYLITL